MAGFKPHVVRELLGVGAETLRYWRTSLDPDPKRLYFSSGRVLLYRILTVLIRHHFIPVQCLQRCDIAALSEQCEQVALNVLAQSYLYTDPARNVLRLCEVRPSVPDDNFDALVVPLKGIVERHRDALEQMGRDSSQPKRLTLHAGLIRIERRAHVSSRQ